MSFWQMIKTTCCHPSKVGQLKQSKWGKLSLFIFLLLIISLIPFIYQLGSLVHTVHHDIQSIQKQIPSFSIKDDTLHSASNKGFIYQGQSFTFTFDPENKRDLSDIKEDASEGTFAIDMNHDKVMAALPKAIATMLDSKSSIDISYKEAHLNGMTKSALFKTVNDTFKLTPTTLVVLVISSLIPLSYLALSFAMNILMLTLATTLYTNLTKSSLTWKENLKLCILTSFWPTIFQSLGMIFAPTSMLANMSLLLSLFFYFVAIRNTDTSK